MPLKVPDRRAKHTKRGGTSVIHLPSHYLIISQMINQLSSLLLPHICQNPPKHALSMILHRSRVHTTRHALRVMSLPHQSSYMATTTSHRRVRSSTSSTAKQMRLKPGFLLGNTLHRQSSTNSSPNPSERSTESLPLFSSSDSSDSEGASTPNTDPRSDSVTSFDNPLHTAEIDKSANKTSNASTKLLTQDPEVLRNETDEPNESGAALIQKYCCGGGCCFSKNKPAQPIPSSSTPLELPDNDAFRSLGLNIDPLYEELELVDIAPLPEKNVSLEQLPSGQTPDLDQSLKTPPHFVQPHPPYDVFSAPLYHARVLTKPGAEKKTFHFDIDVTDYPEEGGVDFKTGGAIGVCPANYPEAVEDIFDTLGVPKFLRDRPIMLKTRTGRWPTIWGEEKPHEFVTTRRQILTWCSDLQSYPPTKALFCLMAEHASAANEKKTLEFLTSSQGQSQFCNLRTGPHLSLTQLLHAFPSSRPPLDDLLSVLNQLMPRFYSLSNDPHISSDRDCLAGRRLVEVAATVHDRPNWKGGHHHGVGSGFLERIAKQFIKAEDDAKARGLSDIEAHDEARRLDLRVPMFRGLMANPLSREFGDSNGPMMLIGAGVGMAPFRGFILNRLRNANCASKIWLVQGVRDSNLDELYSGELGQYESQIKKVVQSRVRKRLTGADRCHSESEVGSLRRQAKEQWKAPVGEAAESKYVQDELRQQADIVWDVIRSVDGRVFVCGSSSGMGEGVEQALREVAVNKGGFSQEGAKRFWDEQKEVGKYIAETW